MAVKRVQTDTELLEEKLKLQEERKQKLQEGLKEMVKENEEAEKEIQSVGTSL